MTFTELSEKHKVPGRVAIGIRTHMKLAPDTEITEAAFAAGYESFMGRKLSSYNEQRPKPARVEKKQETTEGAN